MLIPGSLRRHARCGRPIEHEKVVDAHHRRRRDGPAAGRRVGRAAARYDVSSPVRRRLRRRAALARACKRPLRRDAARTPMITDGFGSSETGAQGSQRLEPGAERRRTRRRASRAWARARRCSTTTAPGAAGLGRRRPGRPPGHIPLGYYNDPEKTAETFVEVDGERWVITGDMATVEADGIDHAARPRLGVHQHRRREGVPRGGRGRAQGAPRGVRRARRRRARRALGRAGRARSCSPSPAPSRRSRRSSSTAAGSSPATRCPAALVLVDQVVRSPVGKADYRWAKQTALGSRDRGSA